jgi:Rrf2 family protein
MLKISDAASLALHTMVLLAANTDRLVSNKEIARILHVSEAHLSKVLQRLSKVGLVYSVRGPNGGFKLNKASDKIALLEIYEAIEGPLVPCNCLLETQVCSERGCILGGILSEINFQIKDYLQKTTLNLLDYVLRQNSNPT